MKKNNYHITPANLPRFNKMVDCTIELFLTDKIIAPGFFKFNHVLLECIACQLNRCKKVK